MTTKNFAFLAALCCTVLVGGSATSQSIDPGQSVETARRGMRDINLGLATKEPMWVDGSTALFTVSETAQRADLNGDGDMEDESIAHIFDATTGSVRNLGLTLGFFPFFKGRLLGFYASEFGSRDLNGDGDTNDGVLHIYDTVRRSLTNLRLSGAGDPFGIDTTFFDGRRLVFGVLEDSEGRDLNQDGDLVDVVPHIFDVVTGRIQNTRLASSFDVINVALADRWIAVAVTEKESATFQSGQNRDLNGDGDLTDTVPHLFDTATGRVTNLRVATGFFPFRFGFNVGGGEGMLVVPELAQGADLNADNDLGDTFLHRVDLASGRVRNTRIAIGSSGVGSSSDFGDVALREGFAVFNRLESGEGKDFNGDGDLNDTVLHTLSTRTGQLRSLGVQAVVLPSNSVPSRAVLFMDEQANGKDLNGDGDVGQSETVLGLADLSGEPRAVSTGSQLSSASSLDDICCLAFLSDPFPLQIGEDLATFVVSEAQEANTDLNGDGDSNDFLLHIADLSTLKIVNTKLSGSFAYRSVQAPLLRPHNGRVVLPVREDREGRDLNRDGDTNDMVLQTIDVRSGRSRNSGFAVAAVPQPSSDGGESSFSFVFEVPLLMRGQGFESALVREEAVDLNLDGDTNDLVLHFFDVATEKVTNTGFAVAMPERNALFESWFAFSGLDPGPPALAPLAPSEFQFLVGPRSGNGPGLGDAYTFIVSEAAQGNIDLNGDGDTDDTVVHATRLTDRDRDGRFDFAEERAR